MQMFNDSGRFCDFHWYQFTAVWQHVIKQKLHQQSFLVALRKIQCFQIKYKTASRITSVMRLPGWFLLNCFSYVGLHKNQRCYRSSPGNFDCIILLRAQWDSCHSNSLYTFNNFCSAAASELEPAHLTQCSNYMPVTLWGTATCLKLSSSKL